MTTSKHTLINDRHLFDLDRPSVDCNLLILSNNLLILHNQFHSNPVTVQFEGTRRTTSASGPRPPLHNEINYNQIATSLRVRPHRQCVTCSRVRRGARCGVRSGAGLRAAPCAPAAPTAAPPAPRPRPPRRRRPRPSPAGQPTHHSYHTYHDLRLSSCISTPTKTTSTVSISQWSATQVINATTFTHYYNCFKLFIFK